MSETETRLPYYPWYIADYRASDRVAALTPMQRGIYRELLDVIWLKGFIPASDVVQLARMARVPVSVMQRAWPAVREMLEPLPGLDGECLTSGRLEVERRKILTKRVKQAEAGKASAASRNGRSTDVQRRSTSRSEQIRSEQRPPELSTSPVVAAPAPHGAPRLAGVLATLKAESQVAS